MRVSPSEILRLLDVGSIDFRSIEERNFFDNWFAEIYQKRGPEWVAENRGHVKNNWLIVARAFREKIRIEAKKRKKMKRLRRLKRLGLLQK